MRVMVACEARFVRTPDGNVYTRGQPIHYEVLSRYLKVFDEVVVLARVKNIDDSDAEPGLRQANGPRVRFCPVPYYSGLWQYLKRYFQITAEIKKAVNQADAYILRDAGPIARSLVRNLRKKGIPYGLEVLTDPWDMFSPGTRKGFLRPVLRVMGRLMLSRQCRLASACSYVTRESLQKRYRPGGWSTYFSDVELPDDEIVGEEAIEKRVAKAKRKIESKEPWHLCFVGNISRLYKGQDILIEAVSDCVHKGMNLGLTIIGHGRLVPELKEQARQLGISDNVKFSGRLKAGKEVFEQLDKADVFILPSRQEGLPRAMVEAMARAMPCIGSSVGGIPELLADEDIVPPGDTKALAAKIEEVLGDIGRLERMTRRNLQTAQEYRCSELSKRWVKFYKKLAEISERGCKRNPR